MPPLLFSFMSSFFSSSLLFLFPFLSLLWFSALSDTKETLTLVSSPNDGGETSAAIPYWWRVTTQIWVVLLISWIKFPKLHGGETSGSVAKCRLFSQANLLISSKTVIFKIKRDLFVATNKIKLRYVLVLAILSRAIMGAFLPITQQEELMRCRAMATEWGNKNQSLSYQGKFDWHFDQRRGNLVWVSGEFELSASS